MQQHVHENEALFGAACYLGFFITGFIFLMIEKESTFVRFHAMQSVVLFLGIFVSLYALAYFPIIGWIAGVALFLSGMILWIAMMWKAFQGDMYKLPLVGDLAEKQLERLSRR